MGRGMEAPDDYDYMLLPHERKKNAEFLLRNTTPVMHAGKVTDGPGGE